MEPELSARVELESPLFQFKILLAHSSGFTSVALLTGSVAARIVGEELGPKIRGFTYLPKTRSRRRWGHRQHYATVEITSITVPAGR